MRIIIFMFLFLAHSATGQVDMKYFDKGSEKLKKGDYEGAIKDFTTHIERNPKSGILYSAYINRAAAYAELKKYDKAIEDYTKSIETYSGDGTGYDGRATIYLLMQQYDKALADCNMAIRNSTKNSHAYMIRGKVYHELKQDDKACQDWEKAKELGNNGVDELLRDFCK